MALSLGNFGSLPPMQSWLVSALFTILVRLYILFAIRHQLCGFHISLILFGRCLRPSTVTYNFVAEQMVPVQIKCGGL